MAEQEGAARERGIGEQRIGRLLRVRGHDRVVLGATRAHEDVLDVEGDRLRTSEPLALGKHQVLPVVEVGIDGQRDVLGPGGRHRLGEPAARDEPDPVAALREVSRDGQEWGDVPVDGHGRDQDR